jgi:hypothetical protein
MQMGSPLLEEHIFNKLSSLGSYTDITRDREEKLPSLALLSDSKEDTLVRV